MMENMVWEAIWICPAQSPDLILTKQLKDELECQQPNSNRKPSQKSGGYYNSKGATVLE